MKLSIPSIRALRALLRWTLMLFLVGSIAACSQTAAPSAKPTTQPTAAATKESKPEAKEAKPEAKANTPEPAAKSPESKVKLKVPYNAVSGTHSTLWITKEKGLFDKYGLDVETPYIASSTTSVQAMTSGEIVLAQTSGDGVIKANIAGADLVMVAATVNNLGFSLYVVPSIQKVEDLKGKSVGVSKYGSSTDFAARSALKKFDLQPDKDVAIVQTGDSPSSLAAMQAGGIQGSAFGVPTTIAARKAGMHELFKISDLKIPYVQTVIAVNRKYLASNEDVVRSFLKAYSEGIAVSKTDKEFAKKVIGKYTQQEDPEVLEETYQEIAPNLPKVPYVSIEGVQTVLDEVAKDTPKAKEFTPANFIDTRLVKELDDGGFYSKLY